MRILRSSKAEQPKSMRLRRIRKKQAMVLTIKITGGEALMYPKIKELLEAFARKRFETIILTNAMKLSKELCDIIARGKMKLGISLDGHIACEHDYIRGDGAFRILLRNSN